jgi:hypothetical protein
LRPKACHKPVMPGGYRLSGGAYMANDGTDSSSHWSGEFIDIIESMQRFAHLHH